MVQSGCLICFSHFKARCGERDNESERERGSEGGREGGVKIHIKIKFSAKRGDSQASIYVKMEKIKATGW